MSRKPVDQLAAGRAHYARRLPGVEQDHFGALWHLFTVGHLVATDLDRIAHRYGCSFADLDLLGTLAIDDREAVRATDLASTLYVSEAVTSTRVAKLLRAGLVERQPSDGDRRAFHLRLTAHGREVVESAIAEIAGEAKIARFFRQLPPEDRQALGRILGDFHQRFHREFVGGRYQDG